MSKNLLSILAEQGEATTSQLAAITKRTARSVHAQLSQLAKAGSVIRVGDAPLSGNRGRPRKVWRLQW